MDSRPPVNRRRTRAKSARRTKMIAKAITYLTAGDRASEPGIDNKTQILGKERKAEASQASDYHPSASEQQGGRPWFNTFRHPSREVYLRGINHGGGRFCRVILRNHPVVPDRLAARLHAQDADALASNPAEAPGRERRQRRYAWLPAERPEGADLHPDWSGDRGRYRRPSHRSEPPGQHGEPQRRGSEPGAPLRGDPEWQRGQSGRRDAEGRAEPVRLPARRLALPKKPSNAAHRCRPQSVG